VITFGIGVLLIVVFVWRLLATGENPKVEVLFSHFETINGFDFAVFQVSNTGKRPVTCYGYGWKQPFYWIATPKGATNWSFDYTTGFDHSKTRPITLPPGVKMPAYTVIPIPESWIVGIEYSSSAFAAKLPRWVWRLGSQEYQFRKHLSIAWSEPITRSSKPTNLVAPLPSATNVVAPIATGSGDGKN